MIIEMLIVLVFILLLTLINKALNPKSKDFDLKVSWNIKGFEFNFKTNKKDAPSSKKRLF